MSPIDAEAAQWVVRMSSGALDPSEQARFDAWLAADRRHEGAWCRARAVFTMLDRGSVMNAGQAPRSKAAAPTRRMIWGGAIAAGLTGIIGVGLATRSQHDIRTVHGQMKDVRLPDHSLARVNSDTRFDVAMSGRLREITLRQGEIWFEVAKNPQAPFIVTSGDVTARAVGTAFSVRKFDTGTEILVTEGVVEVRGGKGEGQPIRLTAGNGVFVPVVAAGPVTRYPSDQVERKLAWREGKIILSDEPLAEAVDEFNRYNRQQIVIVDERIRSARLVGGFEAGEPERFARIVHVVLKVPVRIQAERIEIGASDARKTSHR